MIRGGFDKALHVSPFMAMDQRYTWRAPAPGETLSVHIESAPGRRARVRRHARRCSAAPLTRARSPRAPRYPAATLRMLALIYGHALR